MLIELHTMRELVDTFVLPAAFDVLRPSCRLLRRRRRCAGIKSIPQIDAANAVGALITDLQKHRKALGTVIDKAEGMHDDLASRRSC